MRKYDKRGSGVFVFGLSAVLLVAAAPSRKDEAPPAVEGGTQVRPIADVKRRFDELRGQRRQPIRPGFRLARGSGKAVGATGILHRFDDGMATLAVPVTAEQRRVLKRVGAKEVATAGQIRHHVIYGERYYRELKVAPAPNAPCAGCSEDRLTGPDPGILRRYVGKPVSLVLQRDRDGRTWVVALRP